MFAPFMSSFDIGFWYQLSDKKLNQWKLDNSPKKIRGYFNNSLKPGLPCLFTLCDQSFKDDSQILQLPNFSHVSNGYLRLANTKEDFSKIDKKSILRAEIDELIFDIKCGKFLRDPSVLCPFEVLCFADLKKHIFVYWCCFPSIHLPTETTSAIDFTPISPELLDVLLALEEPVTGFLSAIDITQRKKVSLESLINEGSLDNIVFVCADPSTDANLVGWPCRNAINALLFYFGDKTKNIKLLCLRHATEKGSNSFGNSKLLNIPTGGVQLELNSNSVSSSGWEKNKDKLLPKFSDLSKAMDPKILSKNAVELNLKLMKWRIVPELDLDKIAAQKCLLLGAGTLGCNVARLLLSWGVTKMSLVDNGKVSYSNPVRQSLFHFKDAMDGACNKAEAAARELRLINPCCEIDAYTFSIPMPGHAIPAIEKETVEQTLNTLSDLVQSHDVIFLLLDTREARWLPTLLGKVHEKLVINAALGFDTYLVMRHGVSSPIEEVNQGVGDASSSNSSSKKMLGCYFCSDVMAPGDSLTDRTLDQQCTVTRPGTSMIASSLAVELFASCISHPDGVHCLNENTDSDSTITTPLGACPHQIRGWISQCYKQITPSVECYSKCVACSSSVVGGYKERRNEFLFEVFNDPSYLEDITGLTKMKLDLELNVELQNDIVALTDDEYD